MILEILLNEFIIFVNRRHIIIYINNYCINNPNSLRNNLHLIDL